MTSYAPKPHCERHDDLIVGIVTLVLAILAMWTAVSFVNFWP
jgi:hypothetical protein